MISMEPPADKEYAARCRSGTEAPTVRSGEPPGRRADRELHVFRDGRLPLDRGVRRPERVVRNITLAEDATVNDTGVRDHNLSARVGFFPSASHELFARYQQYRAGETGFGFVEPELYDPGSARVRSSTRSRTSIRSSSATAARPSTSSSPTPSRRPSSRGTTNGASSRTSSCPSASPTCRSRPPGLLDELHRLRDERSQGRSAEAPRKRHILTYALDWSRDRTERGLPRARDLGSARTIRDRRDPRVPNATYREHGRVRPGRDAARGPASRRSSAHGIRT